MKVTLIAHTPEPQRLIEACARISYQTQNDPFDPAVNAGFILRLLSGIAPDCFRDLRSIYQDLGDGK